MDFTTIVGIVAGVALVTIGIGFGNLGNFFEIGSVFIVFGGTFAALVASYPVRVLKQLPKQFKIVMRKNQYNPMEYIDQLQEFALIARKNGLLALEDKANEMKDPFFKEGLMLIVDATGPEKVKEILENDLGYIEERHNEIIEFYEKGASYAPAFGMIGTLIGLVNMLMSMNLEEGAGNLSSNMGTALITTFYGTMLANLVFLPLAKKLQARSDEELLCRRIIIDGILAIQAGENPTFLRETLVSFLPHYERKIKGKKNAEQTEKEK
ncbi:MAG: motility protein A [Clostridia bacterium]|jgi:chemotaxis protein MotA|nr:motility protein A [Clostridia bacterium]MCI1999863.1 motility protein A [Clostridia bacterium]MCI2014221.1 motility protein A [Clostridia bacterium]